MIHVVSIVDRPLHELRYLNAARRGGPEAVRLPFVRGIVDGLPATLEGIVATSDLQGVVPSPSRRGDGTLLGVAVATAVEALAGEGKIPSPKRMGVVLAGDLYSAPGASKRGGYGSVAEVWHAFDRRFAWVVGVAGNHDRVDDVQLGNLLDADAIVLDGLRIGGVGYIAGDPGKFGRRDETDQLAAVQIVAPDIDLLVLHEGPEGEDPDEQPGHASIRTLVEAARVPLVICGHSHWSRPLARMSSTTVLNVDKRVLILTR